MATLLDIAPEEALQRLRDAEDDSMLQQTLLMGSLQSQHPELPTYDRFPAPHRIISPRFTCPAAAGAQRRTVVTHGSPATWSDLRRGRTADRYAPDPGGMALPQAHRRSSVRLGPPCPGGLIGTDPSTRNKREQQPGHSTEPPRHQPGGCPCRCRCPAKRSTQSRSGDGHLRGHDGPAGRTKRCRGGQLRAPLAST